MLTGVFHLHEQQARQVMTPAPAVVTVDLSENVETALRRCVSSGHTRLVVTEDENHDRVKGVVHANALAQLLLSEGPEASFEGHVREAPIVPETKPLDDLLADLQRQRSSLAVVIDEYGRTAGIVTVEDIIEEVVGEIDDETDPLGGAVRRLSNGDWFVRGHVAITDLLDYGLELPVDSDAYNSVGGFVFGELGRLPKRGDTVTHNGYSIRVESVRENRIEAVRDPRAPQPSRAASGARSLQAAAAEASTARRRGAHLGLDRPRRPLTQVPLAEPRSRRIQRPSRHHAAPRGGGRRCRRRERAGTPGERPSTSRRAGRRAAGSAGRARAAGAAARRGQRRRAGAGRSAVRPRSSLAVSRSCSAQSTRRENVSVSEPARDIAAAQGGASVRSRVSSDGARSTSPSRTSMVAKQNCVRNCTKRSTRYLARQPTGRFGG